MVVTISAGEVYKIAVNCDEQSHTIGLNHKKQLILYDHPDWRREVSLMQLGGYCSPCLGFLMALRMGHNVTHSKPANGNRCDYSWLKRTSAKLPYDDKCHGILKDVIGDFTATSFHRMMNSIGLPEINPPSYRDRLEATVRIILGRARHGAVYRSIMKSSHHNIVIQLDGFYNSKNPPRIIANHSPVLDSTTPITLRIRLPFHWLRNIFLATANRNHANIEASEYQFLMIQDMERLDSRRLVVRCIALAEQSTSFEIRCGVLSDGVISWTTPDESMLAKQQVDIAAAAK